MAMIVQHNLRAMNSNRMLGVNSSTIAKSTEKLSSGYKINRAADDAAGLSISEKMRKQIRGLTQASLNAQDGISCVQTAEGALNEVQDMLQRMNELAVKAANGTNSEDDRSYIQAEVDQLLTEIDRVSTTTKFNETYLLKGDPEKEQTEETIYDNFDISSVTAAMAEGSTFTVKEGKEFDETNGKVTYTFTTGLKEGGTWDGKKINSTNTGADEISLDDAKAEELEEMQAAYDKLVADGKVAAQTLAAGDKEFTSAKSNTYKYNKSVDLSLHVGADVANDNKIAMSIDSISTDALHLKGLKVDGADGSNATAAIDKIAEAIQKISTQRSDLGAVQNRLEHTIANLDNVVENTTAAEAQIRDTDMATEMVKYSNTNILTQAGQAMLAQSNQANQGVLSLLQ